MSLTRQPTRQVGYVARKVCIAAALATGVISLIAITDEAAAAATTDGGGGGGGAEVGKGGAAAGGAATATAGRIVSDFGLAKEPAVAEFDLH
jgi:hypothetical protein